MRRNRAMVALRADAPCALMAAVPRKAAHETSSNAATWRRRCTLAAAAGRPLPLLGCAAWSSAIERRSPLRRAVARGAARCRRDIHGGGAAGRPPLRRCRDDWSEFF
ncbi:hypothetical protein F511_46469 [Dorcoceras hygrometricum]|uniref:Uncharacterized protein n=1 Tax=Dorcoceras hygrometricum TaxID=472368 RepID=A0A2Z6ZTE7_9LAMI|nr:hypothetical protein F511_46469 [Dorcoceras hygrometricum]